MWWNVFLCIWYCILNADSTKTHSSSVTFERFCRLGKQKQTRNKLKLCFLLICHLPLFTQNLYRNKAKMDTGFFRVSTYESCYLSTCAKNLSLLNPFFDKKMLKKHFLISSKILFISSTFVIVLRYRNKGPLTLDKAHEGSMSSCRFSVDGKINYQEFNY